MISVIFVDDELLIRRQIASTFLWLDKEVELIGNFSNTTDAIAFLQDHSVDLIIADIRLKNESGMELAKYVHANKLPAKVILLSAYKSFEYAKEGYQYNVAAYLTKPLDIDELKEVIQKQKEEIKQMQKQKEDILAISSGNSSMAQDSAQYILNYFTNMLSHPEQPISATDSHVFFCQLELDLLNPSEYDNNTLYQYITNVFQIHQSPFTYVLTKLDEEQAIALVFSLNAEYQAEFQQKMEQDCESLKKIFLETAGLHVAFKQSYLSVSNQPNISPVTAYPDFFIKSLTENLMTNEYETVVPLLRLTLDTFKTSEDKLHFANLLLEKLKLSADLESNLPMSQLTDFLIDSIREKTCRKEKQIHRSRDKMIADITAYIEQNFYRDISLYDIANHMDMNPSYFSRYFKELFETNFSEYLVSFRINKSKSFLQKKSVPIDAVAAAVGYNHRQAFFKNFKRITGMTPNEYRNSLDEKEAALNEV